MVWKVTAAKLPCKWNNFSNRFEISNRLAGWSSLWVSFKRTVGWYRHVKRSEKWISKLTHMEIDGFKGRERPHKTWSATA